MIYITLLKKEKFTEHFWIIQGSVTRPSHMTKPQWKKENTAQYSKPKVLKDHLQF